MMKVLLSICLLAMLQQYVAGQCSLATTYTQTLVPACSPNDLYIMWPNYENPQTYYQCQSVGNAVLTTCPYGEYFCFVLQECVTCDDWIPPVQCSQLKTQYPPKCVAIGQVSTNSPPITTPTTTPSTTTTPSSSSAFTTDEPTTISTPAPVSPTTPGITTTTDISAPPSPITNAPDVPTPPTPVPTPPQVSVNPPIAGGDGSPIAPTVAPIG